MKNFMARTPLATRTLHQQLALKKDQTNISSKNKNITRNALSSLPHKKLIGFGTPPFERLSEMNIRFWRPDLFTAAPAATPRPDTKNPMANNTAAGIYGKLKNIVILGGMAKNSRIENTVQFPATKKPVINGLFIEKQQLLVFAFIDNLIGFDPWHHRPQFSADLFDRVLGIQTAFGGHFRIPG